MEREAEVMGVWHVTYDRSGRHAPGRDVTDRPCPTITGTCLPKLNARHYMVQFMAGAEGCPREGGGKPPYRVPPVAETAALPWNGLTVASTFAGCGGSALGWRMAGYRVAWANEFDPHAAAVHRANDPGCVLDGRDIRDVAPSDVLAALGMGPGELDVLDGSPPCQGFSMAGKRLVGDARNDLFGEFARLLRGLRPRAFVAENVPGMARGVMKGRYKEIVRDLRGAGYVVGARLLDAQWLGVPQARRRVFIIGVRDDLGLAPVFPEPLPYRYSVRDALPWINAVALGAHGWYGGRRVTDGPSPTVEAAGMGSFRYHVEAETDITPYAIGREWDNLRPGRSSKRYHQLVRADPDGPSPAVTAEAGRANVAGVTHPTERRKFSIAELKRICGFPDDFALDGPYARRWRLLGNAVPPPMMAAVAVTLRDRLFTMLDGK